MKRRPYQEEAVESVYQDYQSGNRLILGVLPTGSGKGSIPPWIYERMGMRRKKQRMLFLVNRRDLVLQTAKRYRSIDDTAQVDVEMSSRFASLDADVVCASVQTMGDGCRVSEVDGSLIPSERLRRFPRDHFHAIFHDEAHTGGNSAQVDAVLRWFKCWKQLSDDWDPERLLHGVTATPARKDGIGLEKLYSKISYQKTIPWMQSNGLMIGDRLFPWLIDVRASRIETELDISQVGSSSGDFSRSELQSAINIPPRNELIVREYLNITPGTKALAFCADVDHAVDLAATFSARGIPALAIAGTKKDGETEQGNTRSNIVYSESDREKAYRMFEEGLIRVLCSAAVMDYGLDLPSAQTGIAAAPTKSTTRFTQRLGRVFRPDPAPERVLQLYQSGQRPEYLKTYCNWLDFVDNAGRHQIVTAPTLYGLPAQFQAGGESLTRVVQKIEELEKEVPQVRQQNLLQTAVNIDSIKTAVMRVDLFKAPDPSQTALKYSKMLWMDEGPDQYRLTTMGDLMITVRANTLGQYEISEHVKGIKTTKAVVNDIREAFAQAEKFVPDSEKNALRADAKWRSDSNISYKQALILAKNNRDMFRKFVGPKAEFDSRASDAVIQPSVEQFRAELSRQYNKGEVSNMIGVALEQSRQKRMNSPFYRRKFGGQAAVQKR